MGVIAFGAVFVISFNYAALTWANKKSSPSVPATSMMLQPPLTFLLGYLIGDRPSASGWEIGGGVVIIAGLILTTMPSSSSDGEGGISVTGGGLQGDYDGVDDLDEKIGFSSRVAGGSGDTESSFTGVYKSMQTAPLTKRATSSSSSTSYLNDLLSPLAVNSRSSSPSTFSEDRLHLITRSPPEEN